MPWLHLLQDPPRLPVADEVDAHGGQVSPVRVIEAETRQGLAAGGHLVQDAVILGLLLEPHHPVFLVQLHEAEPGGGGPVHRIHRHGQVGLALAVKPHHAPEIHAVELVSGEDEKVPDVGQIKGVQVLANRVGRAQIPVLAGIALLGGQDFHEGGGKDVRRVGSRHVPVQRSGIELGQDENPAHPAVEAVGDGNVHQPVLGADGHRRLGAIPGEWIEAGATPSPQNDSQNIDHDGSASRLNAYCRPAPGVDRKSISSFTGEAYTRRVHMCS